LLCSQSSEPQPYPDAGLTRNRMTSPSVALSIALYMARRMSLKGIRRRCSDRWLTDLNNANML
jgi:hypothetical protein